MVDTRKLKQFIKLADLTSSDVIDFVEAGDIVDRDFSKAQDGSDIKSVLELKVSLNGEEPKKLTMNNTTINILKKEWGPDSSDWVGKRAKVAVVETLAFGELKEVSVLKPVVEAPLPQTAPTPQPELTPEQQANVDAGKDGDE
jgi:hypothetical protein